MIYSRFPGTWMCRHFRRLPAVGAQRHGPGQPSGCQLYNYRDQGQGDDPARSPLGAGLGIGDEIVRVLPRADIVGVHFGLGKGATG